MTDSDGKKFFLEKRTITLNADGDTISAGATVTFPETFDNEPTVVIVPPFGSTDVDDNYTFETWTISAVSTTGCTIDIVGTGSGGAHTVEPAFWSKTFQVTVFAHEQL